MAVIQLNYLSKALLRTVDVTVVLPVDTLDMESMTYTKRKEYKTLYLLTGFLVIKMIGFMEHAFNVLRMKEVYV